MTIQKIMNKLLKNIDWKFFSMLFVAIAALYPAWLPYIQSPEKDILIRQISQTALQPNVTKDKTLGLEITVDGALVKDPYFTVLEIENTGRQPILSKDFEGELQLYINKNKTILRAEVTKVKPEELIPVLSFDEKMIQLDPILLNPNDSITLSIISANGAPVFKPSARIVGVQSITAIRKNEDGKAYLTAFLLFSTIYLASIASAIAWRFEAAKTKLIVYDWKTAMNASFTLTMVTSISLSMFLHQLDLFSLWHFFMSFIVLAMIAAPIAMLLEMRHKPKNLDQQEKN